jgi:hypothetical protein
VFGWGALAGDYYSSAVTQRFEEKLSIEDRLARCVGVGDRDRACSEERIRDLKKQLHEKGLEYEKTKENFEKYAK